MKRYIALALALVIALTLALGGIYASNIRAMIKSGKAASVAEAASPAGPCQTSANAIH